MSYCAHCLIACGANTIRLLSSFSFSTVVPSAIRILLPALLLVASLASAGDLPSIEVNGLFGNQAVLTINGTQRILRRGQVSPEGVTLVSSTLSNALLRYKDMELRLDLSSRVSGSFKPVENNEITVPADEHGQFRVQLSLNDEPVTALVDTGASVIVINGVLAEKLGIDYLAGEPTQVVTANGRVESHVITIDKVAVGGLVQHNVRVAVLAGLYPEEVLLGMSFLGSLTITEASGVLTLSQGY